MLPVVFSDDVGNPETLGGNFTRAFAKREGQSLGRLFAAAELAKFRAAVEPVMTQVGAQFDQLRDQVFPDLDVEAIKALDTETFVGAVIVRLLSDSSVTIVSENSKLLGTSDSEAADGWILSNFEILGPDGKKYNILRAMRWVRVEGQAKLLLPDEYWLTVARLKDL